MPARNLPKPVPGPVTSGFGPRPTPPSPHSGVDYAWLYRDPVGSRRVLAPLDAVALVGRNDAVGNFVSLPLGDGYSTRLAHLASVAVKTGQGVRRGDLLGIMGDTGYQAAGVHLHVDVFTPDGKRVDPAGFYSDTYVGSLAPASIGGTPIEPERRRNTMSTLYYTKDAAGTLFALAGDGGGSAAWLETRDQNLANALAAQHGNAAFLTPASFESWKGRYLDGGKLTAAVLESSSPAPVALADATIAKLVKMLGDDWARRLAQ